MIDQISFAQEPGLDADEFIALLAATALGERRPLRDLHRIGRMIANSDIVLTARDDGGRLIGVARSICDFGYCCYLSDLAVHEDWQKREIGRELIRRTQQAAGPECALILLAAPSAETYYGGIGMQHCDKAWLLPRDR